MADSRRVCNHASFLYVFLLSLRWRAQSLSRIVSTKMSTIHFCDTSKGIRPVLRSSCSTPVNNYYDSKRRSRARGVVNVTFTPPALRGARFFFVLPCCVGMTVLIFSTPLQRRAPNFYFSVNSQMIRTHLYVIQISGSKQCNFIYINIYNKTNEREHTNTNTCAHTTRTDTHTHTHERTHAHARTRMHAHARARTHAHARARARTRTRTRRAHRVTSGRIEHITQSVRRPASGACASAGRGARCVPLSLKKWL